MHQLVIIYASVSEQYNYVCVCFSSTALTEEKRRIENRVTTLEEDLEEEQMNNETTVEKARKAQQQADALTQEVASLQSNYNQSESNRSALEKQVHIVCVCDCHLCFGYVG